MSANNSKPQDIRPIEFHLSDAPIHRIQTLALALSEVLTRIPGFSETKSAVFIRRDFDSTVVKSEDLPNIPVFNGTFYSQQRFKEQGAFPKFSSAQHPALDALWGAARNSAKRPRAALARAVQRLKALSANLASTSDPLASLEEIHCGLELYSRVPYQGGLPEFFVNNFDHNACDKNLFLAAARQSSQFGQRRAYDDCLFTPGESAERKEGPQPPLSVVNAEPYDQASLTYKKFQEFFDPTYSLENQAEHTATWQFLLVLPIYDYLHVEARSCKDEDATPRYDVERWGAFLGLLFLPLPLGEDEAKRAFALAQENFHRAGPHLNTFATGFLEAEFDEILQGDYEGDDPFRFVVENLGRVDGWNVKPGKLEKGTLIETSESGLTIDLRIDFFSQTRVESAIELEIKDDKWTCWKNEESSGMEAFKFCIARRIRYFYEQAILQHSKQQNAILYGQTRAAHGITRTIDQVLSETSAIANALGELKTAPAHFPLVSFDALPEALRSFKYPVPLYSIAMENACREGIDEDNFRRWLPRIDWIDEELETVGITQKLLQRFVDEISKPLARNSRKRYFDDYDKVDRADFTIDGWEQPLVVGPNSMHGKLLLVVVGELLTEAFQHCDGENPLVSITLGRAEILTIIVENSTTPEHAAARLEKSEAGNQRKATSFLMKWLNEWTLHKATIQTSESTSIPLWTRIITQT